MVQYYWNPNLQQPNLQNQNFQQPTSQQQVPMPPSTTGPSGRPIVPAVETSYIENILRLNIGQPGIFHFSFTHTIGEALNVRNITGSVEEAGRDHVIIKEAATGHNFLFPMIYFDYAEFEGQVNYFPQTIQPRQL